MSREIRFSLQQLQAFLLMSHGYTSRQIAVALKLYKRGSFELSEDAVKQALRVVFRKLGAVDRAHATRLGFEKGILSRCTPDCSVCANGPQRKRTDQGESR